MTFERLKQELVQVSNAYAESFNRQDAAGIAALFVDGGVHVNEAGPRYDIEQLYQAAFKTDRKPTRKFGMRVERCRFISTLG